jgi:hypothetical protein
LRPEDFFVVEDFFFPEVFLPPDDFFLPPDDFFFGTFAPFSRASESPMAIACFLLFTVPPRPPFPLFSVPFLRRRIALSTRFDALLPYFLPPDFFFVAILHRV